MTVVRQGRVRRILAALQFVPTRRTVWAVALAAPLWIASGSDTGRLVAGGVAAAIVIAAIIDAVTIPSRNAIEIRRDFPAVVGVGDEHEGRYEIHSHWTRPVTVRAFDRLPAALTPVSDMPSAITLRPGDDATIVRRFIGQRRGEHALGPVAVRTVGRFGLLERNVSLPFDDSIRGIPSIAAVRRFRLVSLQHRMRAPGIRAVRRRGDGQSFANLRDYVPGDDPRHLDWKATARRGKLITREFAVEQGQHVLIVVDAGRLMTQAAGALPRFEHALSSALVLADVAAHWGDEVGVVVFDTEVRRYVAPARGTAAVRAVRDALTTAEASLVEPDYAAAFRTIAVRQRKRALIVLFSDVIDVRSSRALIAHLGRSATRHLPLVVALRNEELTAAAIPADRRTSSAVYEAAAAEELLTAREAALARMRSAGVAVVNVAPTTMTAAVVNRYLDIKARAAL